MDSGIRQTSPSSHRRQGLNTASAARRLWPEVPEPCEASQHPFPGSNSCSASSDGIAPESESASQPDSPGARREEPPKSNNSHDTRWQDVPSDILGAIVSKLGVADVKSSRLVCRDWQLAVSGNTLQLQPRALAASELVRRFPAVRSLDLKRCKRLQDWDVEGLARCCTLRVLSLDGCETITDAVLIEIRKLPRLTHLNLRNCIKLTDAGVAVLAGVSPPETIWYPLWSPRGRGGPLGASDAGESPQILSPLPCRALRSPIRSQAPAATELVSPSAVSSEAYQREARAGAGQTEGNDDRSSSSNYGTGTSCENAASGSNSTSGTTSVVLRPATSPPPLQSLDLSGCLLLSEKSTAALAAGLARSLTSLQLGGCSRVSTVTDGMLVAVGRCTALRALDLSGCTQITDTGLSHLTSLRHLASLSLWNCLHISGAGLGAFSTLSALSLLSTRGCQQLEDPALGMLCQLSMLRRLDMRACEALKGEEFTRLSRLSLLSELNLRGCYGIVDSGLEAVGSLKSLQVLNLQECWQITERGLINLSGLSGVMELNLQGCRNLANVPGLALPGLGGMWGVTSLSLRNCDRLNDGALQGLTVMRSLKHLDVSGCKQLTGSSLAALPPLASSLVTLRAQHCMGLRGPVALCALSSLTALTSLNLGGCVGLHGAALGALRHVAGLKHLSLEGCRDVKGLNEGLATLGPHHALTSISLQGCNTLGDAGLEALGALSNLASVNAGDCSFITGSGFAAWEPLSCSLTSLQLHNSALIDDNGLQALAGAFSPQGVLKELNLKHCKAVTDAGVAAFATVLGQLTSLSLQGMVGLTDEGMSCLGQMSALRDLEVQFCWQFTDDGISHLTALTALTRLDLMYSWKITDDALSLLSRMTSLLSLNVLGCHRLTLEGKAGLAHLIDSTLDK